MELFSQAIGGVEDINIISTQNFSFRQNTQLITAIDKLYNDMREVKTQDLNNIIPNKKLKFDEVRKIVEDLRPPVMALAIGNTAQNNKKQLEEATKKISDSKKLTIKKIESILEDINKAAIENQVPQLQIRNQRLWTNCIFDSDRVTLKSLTDAKKTTVVYSSTDNKNRFNAIVFVLSKVHELLNKNITVTRRELFYQNVTRFRKQLNADVAVRDACCLLDVPPWELGVMSTAKGLIAGPLRIVANDGKVIDCMVSGGTIIPQDVTGIKALNSTAKYILVIEKDAIFQKLLDEGALLRLGPVILITGKGYPDVSTRQLLARLCSELKLRALALVDADPHGYEIFMTYKYGSLAQSHLSSQLACPSLLLLGAKFSDIMTLAPDAARLKLTELDKRKIGSLLKRPYLNSLAGKAICEELSAMLFSGIKAELEALAPTAAALCDAYLPSKIIQGQFLG